LGVALNDRGDVDEAIESYSQAIKIKQNCPTIYYNLGVALNDRGDVDEAIESYNQAIKIKPDYAEAYCNLGLVLADRGNLNNAIISYKKAIQIQPDYAEAHYNLGFATLMDQQFDRGFKLLEWRWQTKQKIGYPLQTSKPLWNGEKNETVFVWAEQGLGDEIMFASLIPELHAVSSKLIVQCDQRLIPLFQRSFPKDIIYQSDRSLVTEDSYTFQSPIGSLARIFRPSLESFQKTSAGYLCHDEPKSLQLRKKLLNGHEKTLVGISWKTMSS